LTPDAKRLTDEFDKLRAASQEPLKQLKAILAADNMQGLEEFNRTRLYPAIEPLSNKLTELINLQLEAAKAQYEKSLVQKAATDRTNITVILVAAILCIALAMLIARQINGELGDEPAEVAHRVERIAAGDLSTHITIRHGFEDSMLGTVERMRVSLNDIISKIRASSEQLGEDSEVMSDNGRKVMEAANIQNEATSAIAAAVEQMSVNITHISDSAADARQNSKDSSSAVDHGIEVVRHSVQGMNGIMEITETTAKSIQHLTEKSSEISKIVSVIKDIADQTNLLALNAAIEAARAGEAGRGFAVVADEVRKLAERTTQSTAEIVSMVESIQGGTKNTLTNTTASQAQVADGARLANDTGTSMNEVKLKIDETLGAVNVITDALTEQSAASQQIGRDVERIAQMTDENASSVGKLNDTAAHIKTLAVELNKLVGHFQV
jgi:methyl-accepting chemotaxis protein